MTDHTAPTVSKAEAAAILECTTKTIERLTAAAKLTPIKKHGKRGVEVYFLESEVEALKQERATATHAPRPTTDDRQDTTALQRRDELAPVFAVIAEQSALVQRLIEDKTRQPMSVAIESKPLLTLDEARALTGLSRNHLLEAIHAKKLKARVIGRAWRIKRSDLDAYLKKL